MRYTFDNDGGKEALLKRCYRRFQVVVGTLIVALIGFALAFTGYVRLHGLLVALVSSAVIIGSMLYLRSRIKRDGIDSAELQSYIWRQPMMIVVWVIMVISIVVHFYQVLFPK
jgi:hypothetical protein